jgi:hypothetical protein
MVLITSLVSSPAQHGAEDLSAKKLLEQARVAIATEIRLNQIQSLSACFNVRKQLPNGEQITGEVQLDFLLPEKFVKAERWTMPGNIGQIISSSALNGNHAQSDARATSSKIPILRNDGADTEKERLALVQKLRNENAFYLLQLLLRDPSNLFSEFAGVGEAQAEDGRADVVDVKSPGGLAVRLFFDKESHHLLLMSYRELAPQRIALSHGQQDKNAPPEEQSAAAKDFRIEVQLRFSDYRAEDGVSVPHLIVQEKNGKVTEERKLKSFNVNPTFQSNHFEVKSKGD